MSPNLDGFDAVLGGKFTRMPSITLAPTTPIPCSGCSASTQDSLTPTQPQLRLEQEQLSSLNGKGKCLCANWDVVNPVIPPQSAHLNPCCSRDPAPLWLRSAPQVCWPLLRPGSTSAQVCSGLFTLAHPLRRSLRCTH